MNRVQLHVLWDIVEAGKLPYGHHADRQTLESLQRQGFIQRNDVTREDNRGKPEWQATDDGKARIEQARKDLHPSLAKAKLLGMNRERLQWALDLVQWAWASGNDMRARVPEICRYLQIPDACPRCRGIGVLRPGRYQNGRVEYDGPVISVEEFSREGPRWRDIGYRLCGCRPLFGQTKVEAPKRDCAKDPKLLDTMLASFGGLNCYHWQVEALRDGRVLLSKVAGPWSSPTKYDFVDISRVKFEEIMRRPDNRFRSWSEHIPPYVRKRLLAHQRRPYGHHDARGYWGRPSETKTIG